MFYTLLVFLLILKYLLCMLKFKFANCLFISLFLIISCGCTATRVSSKPDSLPTKSFVKILHTTKVDSCKIKGDPKCPIGVFRQMGSGMAVDIFPDVMTVLTAGHVCDSQPTDSVDKVEQFVHIVDHLGMIHQAWVIHTSFYNKLGSADLCLLWAPTLDVDKVKVSTKGANVGEEVFYIGAPLGIHHPPTVPIFKGIYSGLIDPSSAMVTFPAAGGSSGSAVLNKNMKIVGVVFAANREFHHVSIITSFQSLRIFIIEVKKKYSK